MGEPQDAKGSSIVPGSALSIAHSVLSSMPDLPEIFIKKEGDGEIASSVALSAKISHADDPRDADGPKEEDLKEVDTRRTLLSPALPFVCTTCQHSFGTRSALSAHEQTHLEGDRKFVCKICHTTWAQKQQLISHTNANHNDSKPYTCCVCNNKSASPPAHNAHCVQHKDLYYYCTDCCMGFTASIGSFYRDESASAGEERYSCTVCDEVKKSLTDMKRHHDSSECGRIPEFRLFVKTARPDEVKCIKCDSVIPEKEMKRHRRSGKCGIKPPYEERTVSHEEFMAAVARVEERLRHERT